MSKVAFIFPGQGAQSVGMGQALYEAEPEARRVIDAAHAALAEELDLRGLLFEGPEEAQRLTANTQPAILTVSAAAHAALRSRLPELVPARVAGHSLGEWSALVAAGSLELDDAVRLVRARGRFMQEAVPEGEGAMAAVVGLDGAEVARVCAEVSTADLPVAPANLNAPDQTVVAGAASAVASVTPKLKAAGARRVLPLPVSAPFHTVMMNPVRPRLHEALAAVGLQAPSVPLLSNVDVEPSVDPERIRENLVAQVSAPVRWVETVQRLAADGITHLIELGPGRVLSGLVRRIDRTLTCHSVFDPDGLETLAAALEAEPHLLEAS